MPQSFTMIAGPRQDRRAAFARDVRTGLTASPKHLSCCYLYDREGSLLFEEICKLPEYYLTRAESEILESRADELAARLPAGVRVVELGSGYSVKTRLVLAAILRRQPRLLYVPVDICSVALQEAALALRSEIPNLEITALAAEYHDALGYLKNLPRQPQVVLWLGSNIGNFHRDEAAAFLEQVREPLAHSDRLLLGIDLRKDRDVLEPAYDDARGVTAEFNLNLLARINRELDADFDLDAFRHRAVYNEDAGRVEMYLVSTQARRVRIPGIALSVEFAAGETIHTENSYKYSQAEIAALSEAAGLTCECQWLDGAGRFSVNLLAPKA
ncbi:MAG TPA: L-histidine N(alpha)-methyltransferase [Gemmataceae bacterium]|nr:L-histidine N(alpha)-methyltransferase [Gemmataceae bacterium]